MANGVFAQFEKATNKAAVALREIEEWKEKIVEWIREEEIDGKKLKEISKKALNVTLLVKLEPNEKAAKKLTGPCGKLISICKKMQVHEVLQKAEAQRQSVSVEMPVAAEVCIY